MVSEVRKLQVIEAVLKINSETILAEIEDVIKRSRKAKVTTSSLSAKYAGSLKLTEEEYANFQDQVREGRNQWERDI